MMKFKYLVPLFAAALLARSGAPAQATPIVNPAAPTVIRAATLNGARDLGHAADKRVDFSIVLPYRHAADLPYLLQAQRDRGSKYYRRFLKPAEFRAYFSPTPAVYAAAAAALRSAGFFVETFANRTVLHAYGKVSAAERYFHTTIDQVRQTDGRLAYANLTPAAVPSAFAGSRIVGLNGIVLARTAAQRHSSVRPQAVPSSPLFGPDGGYGPVAIAKAEDFPIEHGYRGTNSNVADLIDGPVTDSDVATYLGAFGLQRSGPRTTTIAVDGGCGEFCFDGFSAVIDAESILGVAPGASLFVYELPQLSNGAIVDGFNAIASDAAVNIVNVSFGGCEIQFGDLELAIEPLIAQGSAEGLTYESVAFGGANVCNVPPLNLPQAPANLDTVTGIGASSTVVDETGKQLAQSALSNSNGGVSVVIPLPAWQATTTGVNPAGRNVPDLVLPGQVDGTGPSVYFAGAWVGGFAFVNNAPFAGYLATVQEMYGYANPLGNIAPALYATFNRLGYGSGTTALFSDVKLGCIGSVGGIPVCAKAGYDVAGGIGSIAGGYALAKTFNFGPIFAPTR